MVVAAATPRRDVTRPTDVGPVAEAGFTGYVRPDHGRHLWDENTTRRPRPGYGLYDRALGTQYLLGLWDAFRS